MLETAVAITVKPFWTLALALLIDAAIGDPPWLWRRIPHPAAIIGSAIGWAERRLNRATRPESDRKLRGLVTTLAFLALAALIGWMLEGLLTGSGFALVLEAVVVAVLIAQRSLFDHVRAVASALDISVEAGRIAVAHIVGRDPDALDEHGVARASLESLFENFSDGVAAPAFWYVVFGLPGLLAYKTLNTLDSMIGHKTERYKAFGMAAAKLDDVANWIPARLSALLISAAAAFTPGCSARRALHTALRDAKKHASPNAGWPEAAAAGALNLALAGPRSYGKDLVDDHWMGDGRARADTPDIRRGLYLFSIACLLHLVMWAVIGFLMAG